MNTPLSVQAHLYIPNRYDLDTKKVPMVVMLPALGGMNFLDRFMAQTFCDANIAAFVVTNDLANIEIQAEDDLLPPEDHQQTFYRTGAVVKSIIAISHDDEHIDANLVGVFGVSLGGVISSFTMSTQPEIMAGYFIVAGGDIPAILTYSQQKEVASIRRKRMKEQGFTSKIEYEAFLRQYVTFDPVDMARTMVPQTINMVVATKDDTVPSPNQILLHEAFGKPDARFVKMDHVDAVLDSLFFAASRRKIARFFQKRFKLENPRPTTFEWMDQFSLVNYL